MVAELCSEGRNSQQSAAHLDQGLGQSEELEQISKELNTLYDIQISLHPNNISILKTKYLMTSPIALVYVHAYISRYWDRHVCTWYDSIHSESDIEY